MRHFWTTLMAAVGVGLAAGGVCAFLYGIFHPAPTHVHGFWFFDGTQTAENFAFVGGLMVGVGSALATFGFLMRVPPD